MTAYSQIVARGADAFTFLQGQLSNDLARLATEPLLLAAWCNPKGRVIALLRVTADDAGYRLALPAALADTVVQRLGQFRFRAKVEFATEPATPAALGASEDECRAIDTWRLRNLRAGIPEIGEIQSEKFTPHMLNLDRLDAVSLTKGCYTGQEIVARTHYRGASKRRMLRFVSGSPVSAGDEVLSGDRKVGEVVNAIGTDLLAVVTIDGSETHLSIGDAALEAVPLPYDPSP